MPVLGVCRGMEILNVALGGTLVQHLPDTVGSNEHRHTPGAFGDHEVRLEPDSLAARAAGAERLAVRSHHHQGVDELGEGLVASGWSVSDDVVEAIELPGHRFALGVLWHPEEERRRRRDRFAGRGGEVGGGARSDPGGRARHRAGDGRGAERRRRGDGRGRRPGEGRLPGLAGPGARRPGRATPSPRRRARRPSRGPGDAGGPQRRQADR